jgi:hypothetical protein
VAACREVSPGSTLPPERVEKKRFDLFFSVLIDRGRIKLTKSVVSEINIRD